MSLDVALTLRYAREGDTKMLEDTSAGIRKIDDAAKGAAPSVEGLADGIAATATQAPAAKAGVENLGAEAEQAGGKFAGFKTLAIGAIGGIAGALATAGIEVLFSAALGAAVDYFDAVTNSAKNIAEDLKGHQGLIKDIKGMWSEAEGAASSYGLKSSAALTFESQQNIARLDADLGSSTGRIDRGVLRTGMELTYLGGKDFDTPALGGVLRGLLADLDDGKADIIAWRDEVAKILSSLPTDSPFRSWGEKFMETTAESANLQAELQRAVDLFRALTGDADAAATALGASSAKMMATGTAAETALPVLREYDSLLKSLSTVSVTLPDGAMVRGEPGSIGGGFAGGGYTGQLPTDRIAGVVHGQEYVFDAAATRAIGVDNLEALRRGVRGYAGGGFVGGSPSTGTSRVAPAGAWYGLADDLAAARGAIRGFAEDLWDARSPLDALAAAVKSASQSYLNRAIGAVGDVVEKLIFGEVPAYALGTQNHPGGWAIAGEAGPELLRLPAGTAVVPHRQSASMMGMAMPGGGVTNIFNVTTPNPRAFAESRALVARAAARISGAAQRHS